MILHNFLNKRDDLDLDNEEELNETNETNATSQNIEPTNTGTTAGIEKRKGVMASALAFKERE